MFALGYVLRRTPNPYDLAFIIALAFTTFVDPATCAIRVYLFQIVVHENACPLCQEYHGKVYAVPNR